MRGRPLWLGQRAADTVCLRGGALRLPLWAHWFLS